MATDAPQVLMTYDEQDPLYYLHDGLGSTRQLVRSNGAIRDHYNYDEFGVPGPGAKLSEDGRKVNHNTFGYTGEMWDEEDDLLYLRSRYYAPHIGRFMTRDVFPGYANNPLSMHKYAYVENSPVNFVDPLGFEKKNTKSQYGPVNPRDLYGPLSKNNLINQGTGNNKAPTPTPKKDTRSGGILPDAVGLRWSQAASAGGGVAASQDVLVSKNGVNVYGSVEGNVGVQGGADLSSQLVLAWGTPDGIAGKYQSANLSLVWGIGIDIQYSWSDTSKVFAIGPALGAKIQGSYGRGITVR